ncbi:MAG: carboxypeptidase regulatory-like domain-containing protein [Myxococcota bacterium]
MKRYLFVLLAVVISVLLVTFLIKRGGERGSEQGDFSEKLDYKRQLDPEVSMDKERIERLNLALKNIKKLPFDITQHKKGNKTEEESGLLIGLVVDDERNPLKGCIVTLKGDGQPFTSARRSDISGKFFFDKISVGEYRVDVQCSEGRAERSGIRVEKDKISNIEIVLSKTEKGMVSTVYGNVIDFTTRNPVEGAMIYFSGKEERSSQVPTDTLGRFTLSINGSQKGNIIIEKEGYVKKVIDLDIKEREINLNNITIVKGNIKDDGRKYQGIGAALIEKNGEFVVTQVFENTPAANAGLQKDDRIYQINGNDISSLRLDEVIALIRGDERTNVILTIKRGDEIKNIQIVRETIEIK